MERFSNSIEGGGDPKNCVVHVVNVQEKVRETMEKAFWDGIMDSLKQDEPDYSWVLKLMKEVKDELCEMSPQSWRQEIVETIDIDILPQVGRPVATMLQQIQFTVVILPVYINSFLFFLLSFRCWEQKY